MTIDTHTGQHLHQQQSAANQQQTQHLQTHHYGHRTDLVAAQHHHYQQQYYQQQFNSTMGQPQQTNYSINGILGIEHHEQGQHQLSIGPPCQSTKDGSESPLDVVGSRRATANKTASASANKSASGKAQKSTKSCSRIVDSNCVESRLNNSSKLNDSANNRASGIGGDETSDEAIDLKSGADTSDSSKLEPNYTSAVKNGQPVAMTTTGGDGGEQEDNWHHHASTGDFHPATRSTATVTHFMQPINGGSQSNGNMGAYG